MQTSKLIDELATAARTCLARTVDNPIAALALRNAGRDGASLAVSYIEKLERIALDERESEADRVKAAAELAALLRR